jgi:hypothetical protein
MFPPAVCLAVSNARVPKKGDRLIGRYTVVKGRCRYYKYSLLELQLIGTNKSRDDFKCETC